MTEKQTIKTNREQIVAILKNLHPESDLDDEEVLFGIIIDDYESYASLIESREADIAKAEAVGEIRGRNAKIEELLRRQPDSDGIPDLGGANTTIHATPSSIFNLARNA